jgi:hypothetical protein
MLFLADFEQKHTLEGVLNIAETPVKNRGLSINLILHDSFEEQNLHGEEKCADTMINIVLSECNMCDGEMKLTTNND